MFGKYKEMSLVSASQVVLFIYSLNEKSVTITISQMAFSVMSFLLQVTLWNLGMNIVLIYWQTLLV